MGEEANKQEEAKAAEIQPEENKAAAAEKEEEEKKAAAVEEEKAEPNPPSPFVLYVDLHCVGCAKKIQKSIIRIRGVEGVVTDMTQNQVTIKGVVDPQAVCNKIMKKTKRKALVLSPLPPTEGEPLPQVVTSQVSGLTTVELNVNMHCEACADQLKKKILKMRGVQTAVTEFTTGKVIVTGTMDANKLVEYVYRRTKKQAKIVPQPEPEPKKEEEEKKESEEKPAAAAAKPEETEKKEEEKAAAEAEQGGGGEKKEEEPKAAEMEEKKLEEGGENINYVINSINYDQEENMKRMMYYYQPLYVIERIPPPQLFSDENPNACCIS